MTDNNATQPTRKVGPIRQWIKDHPNIWEFILFNLLSNISTITRFVVTWIGTAIFISGMGQFRQEQNRQRREAEHGQKHCRDIAGEFPWTDRGRQQPVQPPGGFLRCLSGVPLCAAAP